MRFTLGFVLATALVSFSAYATPALASASIDKKAAAGKSKAKKKTRKSTGVHAQAHGKFSTKLLSYAQLMHLSKAKRVQYVKDVRSLLITMERYQQQYEVASNPHFENLKRQVASLIDMITLMPEASAATTEEQLAFLMDERMRRLAKESPKYDSVQGWTCEEGLKWDPWVGNCLLINQNNGETNFVMNCPNGFQAVPYPAAGSRDLSSNNVMRGCVPDVNGFQKMSPDIRVALLHGTTFPQNFFNLATPDQQKALVLNGPMPADAATTTTPNGSANVATADTGDKLKQWWTTQSKPATSPVANGDATTPPATNTPAGPLPGDALTSQIVDTPGVHTPTIAELQGTTDPAKDDAPAAPAAPPADNKCQPPTLSCKALSDTAKAAAITRFRSNGKTDDAICIYGGFLSKYVGSKKVPGGCQPIRQVPYGDKPVACAKTNQSMCNPVVFCTGAELVRDGKTIFGPYNFCVTAPDDPAHNPPITELCAQEEARMIKVGSVPGLPAGAKFKACDDKSFSEMSGPSQTSWNQMKDDTQKLVDNWCTDKNPDLQALFCRECEIITEKIATMNHKAGSDSCDGGGTPADTGAPADSGAPADDGKGTAIHDGDQG